MYTGMVLFSSRDCTNIEKKHAPALDFAFLRIDLDLGRSRQPLSDTLVRLARIIAEITDYSLLQVQLVIPVKQHVSEMENPFPS